MSCATCRGKGWVMTDVLSGLTRPCGCRLQIGVGDRVRVKLIGYRLDDLLRSSCHFASVGEVYVVDSISETMIGGERTRVISASHASESERGYAFFEWEVERER